MSLASLASALSEAIEESKRTEGTEDRPRRVIDLGRKAHAAPSLRVRVNPRTVDGPKLEPLPVPSLSVETGAPVNAGKHGDVTPAKHLALATGLTVSEAQRLALAAWRSGVTPGEWWAVCEGLATVNGKRRISRWIPGNVGTCDLGVSVPTGDDRTPVTGMDVLIALSPEALAANRDQRRRLAAQVPVNAPVIRETVVARVFCPRCMAPFAPLTGHARYFAIRSRHLGAAHGPVADSDECPADRITVHDKGARVIDGYLSDPIRRDYETGRTFDTARYALTGRIIRQRSSYCPRCVADMAMSDPLLRRQSMAVRRMAMAEIVKLLGHGPGRRGNLRYFVRRQRVLGAAYGPVPVW